jgi:HEAT repeat protein
VEVIEPLMKVMAYDGESDQLRELRSAAAGVLAARGDQRGTQMLLSELSQDRYAFNAAVALLEARDPRGEEALVRIVEKDKAEKRFDDKPVILLAQLNNKRGVDELIEALPTILAKGGLYRDYSSQKIHALEILADSRDARAFEVLRDATSAMLRDVPRAALLALGHLGDKRALETLIETLKDFNSPDCRAAASISLGRLGDKAAVDPLILALDDIDVDVQVSAATALGILGEARAAEPLIALLSRKPRRLRLAVIHALGQLGNSAAIEPLKSIINNNDPAVSARAADALRKLNEATKALQPAEKLLEASVEVPISQTDAAKPASTAPSPGAASSTTAKPFKRNPYICDICATSIEKSAGYAYTTRQVVTSIRYWRRYFEGGQEFGADVDGGGVGLTVSMLSGSATPWIVCEDCVRYVDADSKTARDYALVNQEPPGCGAVDPQIACIPAGYGWSLVHNEWPVSIQVGKNPITHDSKVGTRCDFCRRIIYGDEKFGALDASAYKGQMDDGTVFVRKPPPSSQLLGRDTWIACFRCLGAKRRG